ncbi:40005_t:CDS:2, partial [Gigaspora margarita]
STTLFNSYSEEKLYENPWEYLINKKNSAIYLTEIMTVKIEKDSITSNMSENLTNNKIIKANETLMNNLDIFVKNISEEEQTIELGRTNIELAVFNNWYHDTYNWPIEETIPVKAFTNKPELLPTIVPVLLSANP